MVWNLLVQLQVDPYQPIPFDHQLDEKMQVSGKLPHSSVCVCGCCRTRVYLRKQFFHVEKSHSCSRSCDTEFTYIT